MKKLLISIFALMCITSSAALAATTAEFTIDSPVLNVQTKSINTSSLDAAPYIKNDRTMIPVYALNTAFGADVIWNGQERSVEIFANSKKVKLTINSDIITVDGKEEKIDYPAEITNDRTFLPLRAVSENLGYYVYYVHATRQIIVEDTVPVMTVNNHDIPYCMFKMLYENNKTDNDVTNTLLVSDLYLYFEEIDSLYNQAVDAGFDLTADEYEYVKNLVEKNPQNNILSSAMAKDAVEYYIADKYLTDIASNMPLTDEEANKYYEENYVRAKHILIQITSERNEREALNLANQVYKKAKSGADFDKLIAQHNEDPGMTSNPDGYTFTYGEMVEEFENTAFELNVNTISKPVKTSYGYHIIQKLPLEYNETALYNAKSGAALLKTREFVDDLKESAVIVKNIDEVKLTELIK